jgi:hypothetical protein
VIAAPRAGEEANMTRASCLSSFVWLGIIVVAVAASAIPSAATSVHLKAGFSAATLHGELPTDPLVTRGMRKGFGGGLAVTIPVRHGLAIQPEVLFVMKGTTMGEFTYTDAAGNPTGVGTAVQANDYLEVPVLLRVDLPMGGSSPPWLLIGPAFGSRLTNDFVVRGAQPLRQPLDVIRSTDIGIALGLGAALGRMSFESRYTLGVTPAARTSYSDDARNGALLVLFGFAIVP